MSEDQVLELLGTYMELTEKQDEIIFRLSQLLKKQSTELAHCRNLLSIEVDPDEELDKAIAEEVMKEYESMKMEP